MNLAQLFDIAKPVTFLLGTSFGACAATSVGHAAERAAVFDFELKHGSLVQGTPDHGDAEKARLGMISERLREHLASSGQFEVVDIAPVEEEASRANLQACGGCADKFARELGADFAVTGSVYKVSELVLSMSVVVHDAATSRPVTSAIVDLRGNTDESWRRALDYLYRNVLSARLEKLNK